MFGVRNWLTPMHSTSALALSICLARFSLICVGIAFLRGRSTAAKHHPPCPRTQRSYGQVAAVEATMTFRARYFLIGLVALIAAAGLIGSHFFGRRGEVL